MKHHFTVLLFLLLTLVSTAQNTNRKFISADKTSNGMNIAVSDGNYQIIFYNNNIVETSFIPKGETFNPASHALVLKPKAISEVKLPNRDGFLQFASKGIAVNIQKSPFMISYTYKGKMLLSEKNGYIKKDSTEVIDFNLDNSEALYGGGARALGMNRRGNKLQLYNRAHYGYGERSELLNYTIPMVLSSKIYAVHFDNAPIGYLDLDSKKDNSLAYETISGRKTYQVIAADTWKNLIENYADLTGKQPLPPRWAFGNLVSRFGYHSEKEARNVVEKFKEEQIPMDAIILDLYWFGKEMKGTMGNFEFDKDSFPTPEKMIADFKQKNVQTILITEPFILTTSGKWQEAVSKNILATDKQGKPFTYDFYFGNTGLIDIYKPEGKEWFWNIYKKFIDKGVGGWWGDLGEPEVHPSKLQHATGSADEMHNIYGHDWARLVFEGYQKDFPNVRPFILMRAGYSGSQRFGMIPWSGDVGRSWGGLQSQTEISLQMGMQGLAYMHSDLGGFAGDSVDNELYTRWLQYGVFQPIFRPHAGESVPPEAVFREEKTKVFAKASIELRYQFLPYNYTAAFLNSTKGTPLMQPLFFEEPENKVLTSKSDTYLWGNDILVAPVTADNETSKSVYFPKSANWFDMVGKIYNGGTTQSIAVTEENIPYFARGGAFIPILEKSVQSTAEYTGDKLDIKYFYDSSVKESSGIFYDDDANTPDSFQKGAYEIIRFCSKVKNGKITITAQSELGNSYPSRERAITYRISYGINKMLSVPIKLRGNGKIKSKVKIPKI